MPGRQQDWQSSTSVKIFYFPKKAVWSALRSLSADMAREFAEIERIVVFGSLARDEAVPGSDVDLLIVLKESPLPLLERIPRYMPTRFPVGVDVLPYTNHEMEGKLKEGDFFVKRALKEGIELFRKSPTSGR